MKTGARNKVTSHRNSRAAIESSTFSPALTHEEADFTRLGLNPRQSDIVVVKIDYPVPELYNIRGGWDHGTYPRRC